jgi:hypothetical protein
MQTEAELAEFLRTAPIIRSRKTQHGKFGVRKLRLEKDGVAAHAASRTIAVETGRKWLKGREIRFFRDHHIHEPAAYALSALLGMGMVPPAVERSVDGQPASVQLWVEQGMIEKERRERALEPPDKARYLQQQYQMFLFDNLINNIDRNEGNIVIDPGWRLWLIDHSRAFIRDRKLRLPHLVRKVERRLWDRLRSVRDEDLEAAVQPFLDEPERAALLERRRLLVELIQRNIAQRGEDEVLFSW